jgi:hypothetical protein
MPTEYPLDARELEAPLPLEYAIKIARTLGDGEYMKMMHRMKPCKLGDVLDKLEIKHEYFEENGIHYVFAWRCEDVKTKEFLRQRINDEYGRTIAN